MQRGRITEDGEDGGWKMEDEEEDEEEEEGWRRGRRMEDAIGGAPGFKKRCHSNGK